MPPSLLRLSAKSISCLGVFWVFLMKPWSNTIRSRSTQNRTRAIRPRDKRLLTSHNSRPSDLTSGMPIGQENSTSFMSSPDNLSVLAIKPLQPFPHAFSTAFQSIEVSGQAFDAGIHGQRYYFRYTQSKR